MKLINLKIIFLILPLLSSIANAQWSQISPTTPSIPSPRYRAGLVHIPNVPGYPGFPNGVTFLTEGNDPACPIPAANATTQYFNHFNDAWTDTNYEMRVMSQLTGGLGGCALTNGLPTGNMNGCTCPALTSSYCIQSNNCCSFSTGVSGSPVVYWEHDHLGNSVQLLFKYGGERTCNGGRTNQFWFISPTSLIQGSPSTAKWEHYMNQGPQAETPSPRHDHQMLYIPQGSGTHIDGRVILTGGDTAQSDPLPFPTYIATLTSNVPNARYITWRRLTVAPTCGSYNAVSSVVVRGHSLHWDPIRKKIVQTKGFYSNAGLSGPDPSTLEWDGKFRDANCAISSSGQYVHWEAVTSLPDLASTGGARGYTANAYFTTIGKAVAFGGRNTPSLTQNPNQYLNLTSHFVPESTAPSAPRDWWKIISNTNAPSARAYASSVFVPSLNKLFMFGGFIGGNSTTVPQIPWIAYNQSWYYSAIPTTATAYSPQSITCKAVAATSPAVLQALPSGGIGNLLRFQVNAPPFSQTQGSTGGYIVVGINSTNVPLDSFGMTGCVQAASNETSFGFTLDSNGTAQVDTIRVPYDLGFVGLNLYVQAVLFSPSANPAGLTVSNALHVVVGQ